MEKELGTNAQASVTERKPNVFSTFQNGARKGWNIFIKSVLPCLTMSYTLIYIIRASGLADILTVVLDPIMKIFGMPSEAVLCMATAFFSRTGGFALTAAYVTDGALTPMQGTILLPTLALIGGAINQWVRTLIVCGTSPRRQKWIVICEFVLGILSLWLFKYVVILFSN